ALAIDVRERRDLGHRTERRQRLVRIAPRDDEHLVALPEIRQDSERSGRVPSAVAVNAVNDSHGDAPSRQPDPDHNTAEPGKWRAECVTVLGPGGKTESYRMVSSRASRAIPSRTRAIRTRGNPGIEIRTRTVESPARAGRITL